LNDDLVEGGNAEEDGNGVEALVDDVEDRVWDVPAAAEVTEGEAEYKGQGVQGLVRSRSRSAPLIVDRWLNSRERIEKDMYLASPVDRRSSLVETRLDPHPYIHERTTSKHTEVYNQVII
jgi:hypothetical protein